MEPAQVESGVADVTLVPPDALRAVTFDVLRTAGMEERGARNATEALVAADLRGVDSHGVSNMLRLYVQWLADGTVNPHPDLQILREAPATMVYDSDGGLGIAVSQVVMDEVVTRARRFGIAFASVVDARHLGMLAYSAMLALPHDMIGICATAGGPRMVPTFGREARLGTNPLAIAVPAARRPPFVFDSASTVVPVNKLRNAARWQTPLPEGLFLEPDGGPITRSRVPGPDDPDHLAPLGSRPETGSHKGYGLAATVDLLCNVLPGVPFGYQAGHDYYSHFFAALDIGAFNDVERFKGHVDDFLDMLNQTPPAEGRDRVYYAGEAEWETQQRRIAEGIPLHPEVVGWFRGHCSRHGLDASAFD